MNGEHTGDLLQRAKHKQQCARRGCALGELAGLIHFVENSKSSVAVPTGIGSVDIVLSLPKEVMLRLLMLTLGLWRPDYVHYKARNFWELGERCRRQIDFAMHSSREAGGAAAFSGPWLKAWYNLSR